jgi:molybdopterin-guanine dinucleotide biosynthesis protein A
MPMALRRRRAQAAAGTLLDAGERRLRALSHVLDAEVIPEATWRLDDPTGATLRDIDTPADLADRARAN